MLNNHIKWRRKDLEWRFAPKFENLTNRKMEILHPCTLTFTLITNLTTGFKKYSEIPSHLPSHLKKTFAQIPSLSYSQSKNTEILLNTTAVTICTVCLRSYSLNSIKIMYNFNLKPPSLDTQITHFSKTWIKTLRAFSGFQVMSVSERTFFQMWGYHIVFPKIGGQICN